MAAILPRRGVSLLLLLLLTAPAAGGCTASSDAEVAAHGPTALSLRVRGRDLDMAASADRVPGVQRAISALFVSDLAEARADALAEYRDLVKRHPKDLVAPALQARVALLLAESGIWAELPAALDQLAEMAPDGPLFGKVLLAAHGRGPAASADDLGGDLARALAILERPSQTPLQEIDLRPPGTLAAARQPPLWELDPWSLDTLAARFHERAGAAALARPAQDRIRARGLAAWRGTTLSVLPFAVALLGLGLAAGHLIRRRPLPVVAAGMVAAPWTLWRGIKLLVVSVMAGLLLLLGRALAEKVTGLSLQGADTLLLALPLLLWLRADLRAAGLSLPGAFGLRPLGGARPWVQATLVLIGLEQGIAIAVSLVASAAGHASVPSEALFEPAVLGSPGQALATTIDAVIWAPLLEEIAFRGLLYTSLRTALPVWPSALLSALVFAVLHAYSLPAALSLLLPAVVAALVYERTRSLLPCVLAHAFNNAMAALASLLVYR